MLHRVTTALKAAGYATLGITWIADVNGASLRQMERLGARRLHRLHLFTKRVVVDGKATRHSPTRRMSHIERMPSSTTRYHLEELAVARDPTAEGHLLPPITARDRRILDIGCGAGQTLIASALRDGQLAVGIDIDVEALALGKTLDASLDFAAARAEELPLASESFDLVVSRVALPYTDIPRAVAEIGRVLADGGSCWLVLHPMSMGVRGALHHLRRGQLQGAAFQLYAVFNGLLLHFAGRQVPFPVGASRRWESCQTRHGIERTLRAAGFSAISVRRRHHFVVSATRRR